MERSTPQEYSSWPAMEDDPRTYANCPPSNGAAIMPHEPDPFDTSRVFANPSQSRYYSQVTPDLPPPSAAAYYSIAPVVHETYSNVQDEASSLQHTLSKELRSENTNINVNVESNGYASSSEHYSEIDKANGSSSPDPNPQSWPEDLQNDDEAQKTYANVVSHGLPNVPVPPPPPVGPNESPTKSSNVDIAQTMNDLSLTEASPKKLDPVFLAELEKHLGEKEATKNTNATPTTSSRNSVADNTVIPMLRPPPQSIKPKSPNVDQGASGFNFPNRVQNSWQSKSTNIQRPRSQISFPSQLSLNGAASSASSTTDAMVAQIWHQNQNAIAPAPPSNVNVQSVLAPLSNVNVQSMPNHVPSNLEVAAHNVAIAYHQQFPSLPNQPIHQPAVQNSSTLPRPASIAGSVLSEQVYAELKQTVPNLEQLSQSEFNTLYNKTVQQNILRSYHANSNALASASTSMVSK